MIELPFGAQISVSFLHLLRRSTSKAQIESPGAEPRLCTHERVDYRKSGSIGERVDFSQDAVIVPTNRLVQTDAVGRPAAFSKERVWVLRFDKPAQPSEASFEVCGIRLHISYTAQLELKGGTLFVACDKIYVIYES
jgi:hypothetical protein